MNLKEFRDNLRLQVKKLDKSGLAAWIKNKSALLSDQDLIALAQNEIIPIHGYHLPSSETWPIPLIKSGDSDDQRQYLMLPASIVEPLPTGDNLIGAINIRDTDSNINVDIDTVGGHNAMRVAQAGGWSVSGSIVAITGGMDLNSLKTPTGDFIVDGASPLGEPTFNFSLNRAGILGNNILIDPSIPNPPAMIPGLNVIIHSIHIFTQAANTIYLDYDTGTLVTPTIYLPANSNVKLGYPNKAMAHLDLGTHLQLRATTTANTKTSYLIQGNYPP